MTKNEVRITLSHIMSLKPRICIGYSSPSDPAWANIIAHAYEIHAVIVTGAASGPGLAFDPELKGLCTRLRNAGIKPFAYCYSGQNIALRKQGSIVVYGSRPQVELVADLDNYNRWYGVPLELGGPSLMEGVFVDEANSSATTLEYYRELVGRMPFSQAVILNFGVPPDQRFTELRAAMCIAETSVEKYLNLVFPPWVFNFPAERFYHIIYGMKPVNIPAVIGKNQNANAGFYCWSSAGQDGTEPDFGVETELFLPAAAPPTEDPNWASLTNQKALATVEAPSSATAKDLISILEQRMTELRQLRAQSTTRLSAALDSQIIEELRRRLMERSSL